VVSELTGGEQVIERATAHASGSLPHAPAELLPTWRTSVFLPIVFGEVDDLAGLGEQVGTLCLGARIPIPSLRQSTG
jgi:hypothetical protein